MDNNAWLRADTEIVEVTPCEVGYIYQLLFSGQQP